MLARSDKKGHAEVLKLTNKRPLSVQSPCVRSERSFRRCRGMQKPHALRTLSKASQNVLSTYRSELAQSASGFGGGDVGSNRNTRLG